MKLAAIVLAGGRAQRMGLKLPKQFLPLAGKKVIDYSLELFCQHPQISEVIVVCPLGYASMIQDYPVKIALAGSRRQDSVYSGFQSSAADAFIIHDAARPFITPAAIDQLIEVGLKAHAATLAAPVSSTIKQALGGQVIQTVDRSHLFESLTPQYLTRELLEKGFNHVNAMNLTVTDDVHLAELIGHPVELVMHTGCKLKITYPEDLKLAEALLHI
jgi:2-C-methyl-D-erythritol 4-phosphate cytidylyltransferase